MMIPDRDADEDGAQQGRRVLMANVARAFAPSLTALTFERHHTSHLDRSVA